MTRIIGGQAGSLRLSSAASVTRPTSDRVREALFSRLEANLDLEGAIVFDLFAGTGALGLEAASRGARGVWMVDNHRGAIEVIQGNIAKVTAALSSPPQLVASKSSVNAFLSRTIDQVVDVVFIDPPYDFPAGEVDEIINALAPWLATDAWVLLERSSRSPEPLWPKEFRALPTKNYGDTTVYVASYQSTEAS
ncbi:MAG: hypothetical protein ABR66_00540 [Microbacteriaceae bacterium BACL25 MAG-120322-bin65]|jgi:16S rRNA (guanine966-N2)-methyltransferase|nr:MAG: hypothetical protein ABR66_00540 [Microbacteriaceae bacterium BACL25 MAG-120322-bin65]HAA79953.1 16S rRNA (guanine(966)-N(2))-methyltransferase RsmD [Microbacteriaceae bacterium]